METAMSNWIKKLYWQGIVLALAAEGLGLPWGGPLALAVCLVQAAHAVAVHPWRLALPVQVRAAFLLLFVAGSATPALRWVHALQFAGVHLLLVADYCVLARLLTLLPWNRNAPFNLALVRTVLTLPPGPGSVAERLHIAPAGGR
jgi:hypothetical protein